VFEIKIIYNLVKFMATKKMLDIYFFLPLLFVVVGSGIRDGNKIRIRDKHPGSATLVPAPTCLSLSP
jgi:hypothetical protein